MLRMVKYSHYSESKTIINYFLFRRGKGDYNYYEC